MNYKNLSMYNLLCNKRELEIKIEKVVVPKFVADWIELCKEKANLIDCLQGSYHHYNGSEIIKEDEDWLFEGNNQDVVARAWLDGYEVEKEQLYQVQVNDMFFANWGDANVFPTFIIDDIIGARKQAMSWRDKEAAENVAKIVGGKVVKVDEE